nr:unnamed protein product [Callosobruchus analis]
MKNESDASISNEPTSSVTKNEVPRNDEQVVADEETDGDIFVCSHCLYATRSKRDLINHVKVHNTRANVYSCCYCNFRTNSGILFTTHTRTHSSEASQFDAINIEKKNDDNFSQANSTHSVAKYQEITGNRSFTTSSVSGTVHKCTKCTYKTVSTTQLKRHNMVKHLDITNNRITIECLYCNKTFTSKRSLDDHIVKAHPDFIASVSSTVHNCTKCTYRTVSKSQLKRHMVKHHDIAGNNTIHRCIYCNKTFIRKQSLDGHIFKSHPDFIASVSRKVQECSRCSYKTIYPYRLRQHIVAKHPDIAGNRITNRCIYCNKTLTSKASLDDHVVKIHPDFITSVSRKVRECSSCTYKTIRPYLLRKHIVAEHPDIAGNFTTNKCVYCNKTFVYKRSLDDHIVKKHPDFIASVSGTVHKCTKCTYKTVSKSQLKRHMVKHHDLAGNHIIHRCIYCNKTFIRKQSLDGHIFKSHPDFIASVSRKVQECSRCSYKTIYPYRLRRHIVAKHPDIAGNRITNRCIYCNKTLTSKASLDDHIVMAHPDFIASVSRKVQECSSVTKSEMPRKHQVLAGKEADGNTYFCHHCDYAARSKCHLINHMNVHKNSRHFYSCYSCDFRSNSRILLIAHTRTHSSETRQFRAINIKKENYDNSSQAITTHSTVKRPEIDGNRTFRRSSVGSKVHECSRCTYKTILTSHLKGHNLAKHPDIAGNRVLIRCIYCNKTFTSKLSLDDHIVKKHPDFIVSVSRKVHECSRCTYKTILTSHLKGHNLAKHPDIAGNRVLIRCIYCNKTFTSKLSLDDHIVKKHPDFIASVSRKVHECSRCTYKTTFTSCLKGHIRAKHPDIAYNIIINRCIYCNKTFTSKLSLDDHIVKRHPDFIASVSRKVHECSRCTYKTIITSHLKGHNLAKHPDIAGNRVLIRCIYCKKTFTSKRSLEDHIVKTHPDFIASVSRKVHKCTKCSYKTVQTSKLKRHMAKHPDVATGNFITNKCVYCNKVFVCKRSLDDHMVKNHPDFIASVSRKVHDCTKCTFKTVSASLSRRHMLNHPVVTAGNLITNKCTYCNKTFGRKQDLDGHIIKSHPDFIASVSNKVHECTKCSYKTVATKNKIPEAERQAAAFSETGGETFLCYHCEYAARSKRHLVIHMKMHENRKYIYSCYYCDFRTNSRILLTTHTRTHSSESTQFKSMNIKVKHVDNNFSRGKTTLIDSETIVRNKTYNKAINNPSKKVHECKKCTYKTVSTSLLKRHMVKHPDIAGNHITIRCNYCNKTFTRKQSLDDHIVRKHPDFIASVSRKVHRCTKCTYKTTNNYNLKRHVMAKHPDIAGNLSYIQ